AFARNGQSPLARTSSELLISTGEGKISLDRHRQKIDTKSNMRHRMGYIQLCRLRTMRTNFHCKRLSGTPLPDLRRRMVEAKNIVNNATLALQFLKADC